MSRTKAIRLAAMAIESLTATDSGSLQHARDCVAELSFELAALKVAEDAPALDTHAQAIDRILAGEG